MSSARLLVCAAFSLLALPAALRADQAAALKDHFQSALVDAAGQPVSLDTLKGKAVGIYFSAHWCGPCRVFTPELVKFRNANAERFEVVFVSSDRSAEAQAKYMKEAGMQWPTLPLNGPVAEALDKRYEVTGIPTLVILGANGEVLTREGRALITSKPDATLINDPAAKVQTAVEDYKCGNCDKTHQRQVVKLVKG
jgi:nucleoredoxin